MKQRTALRCCIIAIFVLVTAASIWGANLLHPRPKRTKLSGRIIASGLPPRLSTIAEIIDLRGVTEFEISTSEWRQLAMLPLAARLRVMVAPQDMVYGMGRMFQVFAESESRVHVVRSIQEAEYLIQQSS